MKTETREQVFARANYQCEICGCSLETTSANLHHRKPRQMGGTKTSWIHDPVNLLAVCGSGTTGCHGRIESFRRRSYEFGWLVHMGMTPHEVPFCDMQGRWYLLYDNLKLPLHLPGKNPTPALTT